MPFVAAKPEIPLKRVHMRPQSKPFMVEVRNRRGVSSGNASARMLTDRRSYDEIPSRTFSLNVEASPGFGLPLKAAGNPLQDSRHRSGVPARSLSSLAAKVFAAPQPELTPDTTAALVSISDEAPKGGRILPSLFPATPFEAGMPATEIKPPRVRRVRTVSELEAPEPAPVKEELPLPQAITVSADNAAEHVRVVAEPIVAAVEAPIGRSGRKPYRLRAATQVRAGEQWKRRRLPKALW